MNNYNETLGHLILNKLNGVIKNGQSRHTGNIEYTIHRTKTNKIRDKTQKSKKMSNTIPPNWGLSKHTRKCKFFIIINVIYLK